MANILLHFAFVSAIVFGGANSSHSDNYDYPNDAVDENSDANTNKLDVIIQSLESIKKIPDDNAEVLSVLAEVRSVLDEVRSVLEENGLITLQVQMHGMGGVETSHPVTTCHIQILFQSLVPELILQYMAILSYRKNHIVRSNDGKYDLNFPFFKPCQAKDIMEAMFEGLNYGEDCNEYHLIIGILDHIRFNLRKNKDERKAISNLFESLDDFTNKFDEAAEGNFNGKKYNDTIIQSIKDQKTLLNNNFIEDLKTVADAEKSNEDWKEILVCNCRLETQDLEYYVNHDEVEHHELLHTPNHVQECPDIVFVDIDEPEAENYDLCTKK